jgi:glucosamine--fructose-6-phosphate aminotransferase (isomerizing)
MAHARRRGWGLDVLTEGATQAREFDLSSCAVFAASNSGKTAEVIHLFEALAAAGNPHRYTLSAHAGTPLEALASRGYVLTCGEEGAVAATKSVVEQAVFYRALVEHAAGRPEFAARRSELADAFDAALRLEIDPAWVDALSRAGVVYWCGRHDGVGEELTLKTNEITRQRADFLEGTYAVHGVEEVMQPDDVLVWVDPFPDAQEKFRRTLAENIGVKVLAIASRETPFPTLRIPDAGDLAPFVQLAAGWNLLVETGLALGVNLDKPQRARKVGFELAD